MQPAQWLLKVLLPTYSSDMRPASCFDVRRSARWRSSSMSCPGHPTSAPMSPTPMPPRCGGALLRCRRHHAWSAAIVLQAPP